MSTWIKINRGVLNLSEFRLIDAPKEKDGEWVIECFYKNFDKREPFKIIFSQENHANKIFNRLIAKLTENPGNYKLL